MKTIGIVPANGAVIVEISRDEFLELEKLSLAVEGRTLDKIFMYDNHSTITEKDYSSTFGAIRAFAMMQFRINELEQLIKDLSATIWKSE